jgi:hypothetical protein
MQILSKNSNCHLLFQALSKLRQIQQGTKFSSSSSQIHILPKLHTQLIRPHFTSEKTQTCGALSCNQTSQITLLKPMQRQDHAGAKVS